jgi:hypothetical protein
VIVNIGTFTWTERRDRSGVLTVAVTLTEPSSVKMPAIHIRYTSRHAGQTSPQIPLAEELGVDHSRAADGASRLARLFARRFRVRVRTTAG